MCGIVGFFGVPNKENVEAFEDLLHVDVIRGPHSTGVAGIEKKRVDVIKGKCLPVDLLNSAAYKAINIYKKYGWIGHNRYATIGKITAENAHPFKIGKITGVHNGTCGMFRFAKKYEKETDSEMIMNILDKEDPQFLWENLAGPASLVWWNAEKKTMNFLRNSSRPMYLAFLPKNAGVFFASEDWMLEGVLGRNNIEIEGDYCKTTAVNNHYVFKYNPKDHTISYTKEQLKEWVAPVASSRSFSTSRTWVCGEDGQWRPIEGSETSTNSGKVPGNNVYDLFAKRNVPIVVIDPNDRLQGVDEADFRAYYDRCFSCGERKLEFETMQVIDPDNAEAICKDCQILETIEEAVNNNHIPI